MKRSALLIITLVFQWLLAFSQNTITGAFSSLKEQHIKLVGYEGFKTYLIDSVITNGEGSFHVSYCEDDYGIGYLVAEDNKPFLVVLAPNEDLMLDGEGLNDSQTIKIKSGKQNQLFEKYATEHPRREQVMSAWDFLDRIYNSDSLFAVHHKSRNAIKTEKLRIKKEDQTFLECLDNESYLSWFLPLKKLVSSVPTIAQYQTEEIPSAIATFRSLDYTDQRLYKSGLLRETIDAHFWLIENSGRSLDSVFFEMNKSIDYMIDNLEANGLLFNEITNYLFDLLEQRSLYGSSEYLAIKVLDETKCTINSDLAAKLESYRAMKPGNTASDFALSGDHNQPGIGLNLSTKKLSELKNKYTLVVFGASWCPKCSEEFSEISRSYQKWKNYGVEVVYISLEEDQIMFKKQTENFPFISVCDYLEWDSPVVKAYHVFATPTLYFLDINLRIILRPISVQQLDAWIEWYLVQGNM